jgi:hypothetical protein
VSKSNNVNPDHYKVGGRERPGNAVAKAPKETAAADKARQRWQRQAASRNQARGARGKR